MLKVLETKVEKARITKNDFWILLWILLTHITSFRWKKNVYSTKKNKGNYANALKYLNTIKERV